MNTRALHLSEPRLWIVKIDGHRSLWRDSNLLFKTAQRFMPGDNRIRTGWKPRQMKHTEFISDRKVGLIEDQDRPSHKLMFVTTKGVQSGSPESFGYGPWAGQLLNIQKRLLPDLDMRIMSPIPVL